MSATVYHSDALHQASLDIPEELRSRPQWLTRRGKIPVDARTGVAASYTDSTSWSDFATAAARAERHGEALGFVLSDTDPYAVVDLDHCIDPATGTIAPEALAIIEELDSYTEISPSGTGLHVLVDADLPPGRRRAAGIELYDSRRYITVTGKHLVGTRATIEPRQEELTSLHARLFAATPSAPQSPAPPAGPGILDDAEILEHARTARNGERFSRLWDGDIGGYPSHSEADAALCMMLAYWTAGDADQIDRLFRQSALYREKWEREDYRRRTIGSAIRRCGRFYEPVRPPHHLDMADAERESAPSSPPTDIPDEASLDHLGMVSLRNKVTALEALVDQLQAERDAWRTRAERAEEALARNNERASVEARILRHPALKARRQTVVALAREIEAAGATGTDDAVPILLDRLGTAAGKSAQSVSGDLRWLEERGYLERDYITAERQDVDRQTGEIVVRPTTRLLVRLSQSVEQFREALASYQAPEDQPRWGGRRIRCEEHPHAGVIVETSVRCAECGRILHQHAEHAASYQIPVHYDGATPPDAAAPTDQDDMVTHPQATPPDSVIITSNDLRSDGLGGEQRHCIDCGVPCGDAQRCSPCATAVTHRTWTARGRRRRR